MGEEAISGGGRALLPPRQRRLGLLHATRDERFVGRIFRDMAPFKNNKSKAGKANVSKRWDKSRESVDLDAPIEEHHEAAGSQLLSSAFAMAPFRSARSLAGTSGWAK